MAPSLRMAALLIAALALVAMAAAGRGPPLSAQTDPIVSVDAVPDGSNTALTLGNIDPCRSTTAGTSFHVDVVNQGVSGLSGFQADLIYDALVLRVIAVNYNFLLASTGSAVVNLGDFVPDADGVFVLAAATFPAASVTGSGVLARLTIQATGAGTSPLDLANVKLSDAFGNPIPPSDATTQVYLGPVNDGLVAVDSTDTDGDGLTDPCDPDDDNDGWPDVAEEFITTDPRIGCLSNGWPPDVNSNGIVGIDDVFFASSRFNASVGDPNYTPRAEISSQNRIIGIDDVFAFSARFGQSCT